MSLYVIVSSDLSRGMQVSQAMHAMRKFAAEHPRAEARWFRDDNTIVVLQEKRVGSVLPDVAQELSLHWDQFEHSYWEEPDMMGMTTAVAFVVPRFPPRRTLKSLRGLKLVSGD